MPTAAALLSRAGTAWGEPAVRAQVGEAPSGDPLQPHQPPALLTVSIAGRQPQAHLQSPGRMEPHFGRILAGLLHCSHFLQKVAGVRGLQVAPSTPHLH